MNVPFIDASFIEGQTDFSKLTDLLEQAFSDSKTEIPPRHHHDFSTGPTSPPTTLLLMPAWNPVANAGVKIVTVHPGNSARNLPTIQGIYVHLNAQTGEIRCILDAKALTAKRTAAASALATRYLARPDANSMLMIGTGTLSENLIRAHASARPIKQAFVYGRDFTKSQQVAARFATDSLNVQAVESLSPVISQVDIISCATMSPTPLVHGSELGKGQHVDLVGSYRPTMREADDEVIRRGTLFVDTMEVGIRESGDIAIPLQEGVITTSDIQADLFGLCSKSRPGRTSESQITVFKSVGYALEDLVGANYYFEQWNQQLNP